MVRDVPVGSAGLSELPADANVEAWLVTIAHRKVIDLVRKAQRSAKPVAEVPGRAAELDFEGSRDRFGSTAGSAPGTAATSCDLPLPRRPALCGGGRGHRGQPEAARRAAADGIAKLRKTRASGARRRRN